MISEFAGLVTIEEKSNWTCVVWPDSVAILKTGKPVRVIAAIGSLEFTVTLMPMGGKHMVPLRKAVVQELGLKLGDELTVRILSLAA